MKEASLIRCASPPSCPKNTAPLLYARLSALVELYKKFKGDEFNVYRTLVVSI